MIGWVAIWLLIWIEYKSKMKKNEIGWGFFLVCASQYLRSIMYVHCICTESSQDKPRPVRT